LGRLARGSDRLQFDLRSVQGKLIASLTSIDQSTELDRRDIALLHFLYNTGARAQEVVDLRLPAVRFDTAAQVRLLGKCRKERLCPLWAETVNLLRAMLKDREIQPDQDMPLLIAQFFRSLVLTPQCS
jgi:site-specific recombinase XerC